MCLQTYPEAEEQDEALTGKTLRAVYKVSQVNTAFIDCRNIWKGITYINKQISLFLKNPTIPTLFRTLPIYK